MGFAALEDSSSTATAEIAVNGMDPPELGFPPAEPTKGTSGQWRRSQADKIEARVVKEKKNLARSRASRRALLLPRHFDCPFEPLLGLRPHNRTRCEGTNMETEPGLC